MGAFCPLWAFFPHIFFYIVYIYIYTDFFFPVVKLTKVIFFKR